MLRTSCEAAAPVQKVITFLVICVMYHICHVDSTDTHSLNVKNRVSGLTRYASHFWGFYRFASWVEPDSKITFSPKLINQLINHSANILLATASLDYRTYRNKRIMEIGKKTTRKPFSSHKFTTHKVSPKRVVSICF